MSGKTKSQKKKRAKMKKRIGEDLRHLEKKEVLENIVPLPVEGEVLGNNAEPPPLKVNEDEGKEIPMQTLEDNVRELEAREAVQKSKDITDQIVEASKTDHTKPVGIPSEPVGNEKEAPFDPSSVVANILKKKDVA